MAILCLCENLSDLKRRLGNIFVGFTFSGKPVFARDLNAHGAMAALLKNAIQPNLVQTLEGTPAIIHGGPFANIAQGTNSVIATKMGMSLSDYVVTEAGFGADLGAEKFLDIKCVSAGIAPSAVVIVATIRALKYHGGANLKSLKEPDADAVARGLCNLEKHLENIKQFGLEPVVAINLFASDTPTEIAEVKTFCISKQVDAVVANVWEQGGAGAKELAAVVVDRIENGNSTFKPVYQWEEPVRTKIDKLATRIYGARQVKYSAQAENDLKTIQKLELENLPICVAKTQKSLSDNPKLIGRPEGFDITIREIEIAAGAGFLVPITGEMMRMPGLPATPAAEAIDIDENGQITGLF